MNATLLLVMVALWWRVINRLLFPRPFLIFFRVAFSSLELIVACAHCSRQDIGDLEKKVKDANETNENRDGELAGLAPAGRNGRQSKARSRERANGNVISDRPPRQSLLNEVIETLTLGPRRPLRRSHPHRPSPSNRSWSLSFWAIEWPSRPSSRWSRGVANSISPSLWRSQCRRRPPAAWSTSTAATRPPCASSAASQVGGSFCALSPTLPLFSFFFLLFLFSPFWFFSFLFPDPPRQPRLSHCDGNGNGPTGANGKWSPNCLYTTNQPPNQQYQQLLINPHQYTRHDHDARPSLPSKPFRTCASFRGPSAFVCSRRQRRKRHRLQSQSIVAFRDDVQSIPGQILKPLSNEAAKWLAILGSHLFMKMIE